MRNKPVPQVCMWGGGRRVPSPSFPASFRGLFLGQVSQTNSFLLKLLLASFYHRDRNPN